jgi:hypothetical protein
VSRIRGILCFVHFSPGNTDQKHATFELVNEIPKITRHSAVPPDLPPNCGEIDIAGIVDDLFVRPGPTHRGDENLLGGCAAVWWALARDDEADAMSVPVRRLGDDDAG